MSMRPLLVSPLAAWALLTLAAHPAGGSSPQAPQSPPSSPAPHTTSRSGAAIAPEPSGAPVLPRVGFAYCSVFDEFRRFAEAPVGSWREANDTVMRIGGWRAYAAEAQAAPTEANIPSPRPEAASPPHSPAHGGRR